MSVNQQFYETIIRYYDAENATFVEDLALYQELAGEVAGEDDGTVFVLGCGTGRVLLALADAGFTVTGLDRSAAMLARARRKLDQRPDVQPRVTLRDGDALQDDYGGPFSLILVPYNTFMHFDTQDAQLNVLRRCAAALDADDGLLVLDLPNAGEAYATQDHDGIMWERTFSEPESGHLVMEQSVSTIDRAAQMLYATWIYDELHADGAVHRTLAPITLRYVLPGELTLMLHMAGLSLVDIYGDYDQSPFQDGAPRMIVLAEKA